MLHIYSVYDKKTCKFMTPFFVPNLTAALRGIQSALVDRSNLTLYPGDFSLYDVGQFDDDVGAFVPGSIPQFVEEIQNLLPIKHSENPIIAQKGVSNG